LQDNWIQAREPVLDGVTFCVKFLGSTLIDKAGATDAAEATKTVIQMVKAGQKTSRVGLKVSTSGITILEPNTGETRLEISIYDIAHCSTDSSFPNVFSFIATNKNDVNECYCFAARKRKMAQQITLTIAQSFNLAFEIWQNSSLEKDTSDHFGGQDNVRVIIGSTDSAQSCSSSGSSSANHNPVEDIRSGQWVHFDEVDEITDAINNFNMVALTPFRQEKTRNSRTQQSAFAEHEDLLICLN
ncbi:Low density lipoprotein receptor adapter protein 1-B, partial [Orchesella cincta]